MMKKVYLASGWFTPEASKDVDILEGVLDSLGFDVFSPRREFICPPDAPQSVQESTFSGNIEHIIDADFVVANTRDKDMGTIFEAGVAFQASKPIIYYCAGLPPGAKFNLMLSRSGEKVCSSPEGLRSYLKRCLDEGKIVRERYDGSIE